jgi:hypothetical protein
MSLLTRAGDLVYTFRFLKLLVTNFEDTDAYKNGIIDESGKRIKTKFITTPAEKSSYTPFHKLVFNIKKIMAKAPGGGSKLASYAAALFLLKEEYNLTDKQLDKILQASDVDMLELIDEQHNWFLLDNHQLSPGMYRVRNEKVISETWDEIVNPKDKIRIVDNSFPVGEVFGINVYEGVHINTGKKIHFTLGEIYR